jgi:hypothetical protein
VTRCRDFDSGNLFTDEVVRQFNPAAPVSIDVATGSQLWMSHQGRIVRVAARATQREVAEYGAVHTLSDLGVEDTS